MPSGDAFTIKFVAWIDDDAARGLAGRMPRVRVTRRSRGVAVLQGAIPEILVMTHLDVSAMDREPADQPSPLELTMLAWTVVRVEALLASGETPGPEVAHELMAGPEDIDAIRELLDGKSCDYQVDEGRELYCTAAWRDDSAAFVIAGRRAGPTSPATCASCDLPPAEVLCGQLAHPSTRRTAHMGASLLGRRFEIAGCNRELPGINQPGLCRIGGHDCAERAVTAHRSQPRALSSPLGLVEALDFLDAAWRLLFGGKHRLVVQGNASAAARLGQPCATREDFESALTSLADLIDRFSVPDAVLAPPPTDEKAPTRSLERLDAAVEQAAAAAGHDPTRAIDAIDRLRSVHRVRNVVQHKHAFARESIDALDRLGIAFDGDWRRLWDDVRAAATDAVTQLREELQALEAATL